MTDWLDHWARERARPGVPRRARTAQRWRKVTLRARRATSPRRVAQALIDRGLVARASGRDPVGQQRRPRAARAWRDDRGRPLRAGLAALFAGRQGLRQAQVDPRRPDARASSSSTTATPFSARARRGRAAGRRGRRRRQPADGPAARRRSRPSSPSPPAAEVDAAHAQRHARHDRQSSCSPRARPARPRASSTPSG